MTDIKADPLRAGDVVHHEPTGEDWTVAYVDGDRLAWCGWPDGTALLSDCRLKKSSTDEDHVKLLHEIAASGSGRRARRAKADLAALGARAEVAVTATQRAYALLWREMRVSDRPFVREACTVLLASLTTAEQHASIAWVTTKYPLMDGDTQ